ncbi:MAG: hypothetical protein CL573_02605 [Alphaproteobacteria bacterium]|nr:hypothetical protein [Alphaproteobacteria bacterium]HCP01409.1 hypothetical protein [Rhodospirillaceae bacterium]
MAIQILRTIVIVLGVLILVVLGAVIWTAFEGPRGSSPNVGGENTQPAPDRLSLGLSSPDCVITTASTDAGRLTIITAGPPSLPDCHRVFVIQLSSGRVQMEIGL